MAAIPGLAAYWRMDDVAASPSASPFADVSGNGRTLTVFRGATQTLYQQSPARVDTVYSARIGHPIQGQCWTTPDAAAQRRTGGGTLLFYVRPMLSSGTQLVLNKNTAVADQQVPWQAYVFQQGALVRLGGSVGDGASVVYSQTGDDHALDTWAHYAMVIDTAAATLRWYRNGAPASSPTWALGAVVPQNIARSVGLAGLMSGSNGLDLCAFLDELAIVNRAMTTAEIAALFVEGPPRFAGEPGGAVW